MGDPKGVRLSFRFLSDGVEKWDAMLANISNVYASYRQDERVVWDFDKKAPTVTRPFDPAEQVRPTADAFFVNHGIWGWNKFFPNNNSVEHDQEGVSKWWEWFQHRLSSLRDYRGRLWWRKFTPVAEGRVVHSVNNQRIELIEARIKAAMESIGQGYLDTWQASGISVDIGIADGMSIARVWACRYSKRPPR